MMASQKNTMGSLEGLKRIATSGKNGSTNADKAVVQHGIKTLGLRPKRLEAAEEKEWYKKTNGDVEAADKTVRELGAQMIAHKCNACSGGGRREEEEQQDRSCSFRFII